MRSAVKVTLKYNNDTDYLSVPFKDLTAKLQSQEFEFSDDLAVIGSESPFGAPNWSFYNGNNPRHKLRFKSALTINWEKYEENYKALRGNVFKPFIPVKIRHQLRRFAWLFGAGVAKGDAEYFSALIGRVNIKIITYVQRVDFVCRIVSWIIYSNKKKGKEIDSLSDIDLETLTEGLVSCPFSIHGMKSGLLALACDSIRIHLSEPLSLTVADIDNMPWSRLEAENFKLRTKNGLTKVAAGKGVSDKEGYVPLHPLMFMWLSNQSRAHVREFLEACSLPVEDMQHNPEYDIITRNNLVLPDRFCNIKARISLLLDSSIKTADKIKSHNSLFGISLDSTRNIVDNARRAAEIVVLLYTGMRYSDAAMIKPGCIIKFRSYNLILSTNIKHKPDTPLTDMDSWVATSCIRDAIRTLEYITAFSSNTYLFSTNSSTTSPIANMTLCKEIYLYIWSNDINNQFVKSRTRTKKGFLYDWKEGIPPHLHRFRESLALELARVDCGIPFITLQLHHMYSILNSYISDTTLEYGSQKQIRNSLIKGAVPFNPGNHRINPDLISLKSKYAVAAREEIFKWLCDYSSKMTGMRAEGHKKDVEEVLSGTVFFLGKCYSTADRESLARKLAKTGAPLVLCEYGYCGKKYDDTENICKGDKCPADCPNHLVLETGIPKILRRWAYCINGLKSKEDQLLWPKLAWDKDWYERQLNDLGVDVTRIDAKDIEQEVENFSLEIRLRMEELKLASL